MNDSEKKIVNPLNWEFENHFVKLIRDADDPQQILHGVDVQDAQKCGNLPAMNAVNHRDRGNNPSIQNDPHPADDDLLRHYVEPCHRRNVNACLNLHQNDQRHENRENQNYVRQNCVVDDQWIPDVDDHHHGNHPVNGHDFQLHRFQNGQLLKMDVKSLNDLPDGKCHDLDWTRLDSKGEGNLIRMAFLLLVWKI